LFHAEHLKNYLILVKNAHKRGISVIIAGAGGAAHLPGMVASMSPLPVIGVPVSSNSIDGWDSVLSILQMPGGVPVATVALNGAKMLEFLPHKSESRSMC
jgi:5-(carboxyamino)imidazole ribonucleotide mutase